MSLTLKKTHDTPYIHLKEGLIEIKGRLMPENVLKFFSPVKKWIEKYSKNPDDFTKIDLFLPYVNSSSIKQINDLLKILNLKYNEGCDMKIFWTYEEGDDSALEIGNDLESMLNIPFEYNILETEAKNQTRIKVKNKITGKIGEISRKYWETIKRTGHEKDFELLEKI